MAWVRTELGALKIPPLKRFGQHFLIDEKIRDELVESGELTDKDTVLEVGAGLGFLTSVLANKAGLVIAVEKDRTLATYLKNKFSNHSSIVIVEGDVFKVILPDFDKIVSSPPYNISSKLVLMILKGKFKLASLLLQEEFARRLTAASGSRDYGRLTVMFQSRAQANVVGKVSKDAFYPKPRVESAIIQITPKDEDPAIRNNELFTDLVRSLFGQRRRRLSGVLARYLKNRYPEHSTVILQRISPPEKRVFEVTPKEFARYSNQIDDTLNELGLGDDKTGD
jgi:16S rRNA (adenine1518-N6/adenine1519-N6)-dimethyltransferase